MDFYIILFNKNNQRARVIFFFIIIFNDPSAGSPTDTLLRLLLPLNDKV